MTYYDNRPGDTYINLGDEGLQNGDHISAYIDDFFVSGNQVFIPEGEYYYDGTGLSGQRSNAALIGDPNGVIFHRPSDPEETVRPFLDTGSGDVVVENFTVKGVKGRAQSRWAVQTNGGGNITFRNINFPDGTKDCSDSQCWYLGRYNEDTVYGDITFDRCYIGPHANAPIYGTYASGGGVVNVTNCQFENSNEQVRLGPTDSYVAGCDVFGDGFVPAFGDPNTCSGSYHRFLKIEDPITLTVENCTFRLEDGCDSPGPFFDQQVDGVDGVVRDCKLYNETSKHMVSGGSGMDASGIHVSGPGERSVPWPVAGNDEPQATKTVWTPAQADTPTERTDSGGTTAAGTTALRTSESVKGNPTPTDHPVVTTATPTLLATSETIEEEPTDPGPTPTEPLATGLPYHWDVEYQTSADSASYLMRPERTVIEDFEAGNMDNYWVRDTSATYTQQTTVHSGNYALCMPAGNGGSDPALSVEGGGLPYYPRRGDTFRVWFQQTGDTVWAFQFAVQRDTQDGYNFWEPSYTMWMDRVTNGDQRVNLVKYETDGTQTTLARDYYTGMYNQWNYIDVDFGEDAADTITSTLYDGSDDSSVLTIHGTDAEYDRGGIAWVASANMANDVYVDTSFVTETRL